MKIILIGPPGVGKGTQGVLLSEALQLPVISTGQVIRDAIRNESEGSKALKDIVARGELVPDNLMVDILDQRMASDDCLNGYILDGFPRTLNQAQTLQNRGVALDYVVEFALKEEAIIKRLSGRLYHPASGRIYHKDFNPPKSAGLDDITQEALVVREDDKPESIAKRLTLYKNETSPLINFYKQLSEEKRIKYICLDASGAVDNIQEKLLLAMR